MIHLILVLTIVVGANTTHARVYEGPFNYGDRCEERAHELLQYTKLRMGFLTEGRAKVSAEMLCYTPERRA